ncbi:hypothetical protein QA601_11390 [Chitinispirillales bacterium ANBcel5]|nr:hypothetical protein [Chitinispirillales bacterium ANBcel5]
MSMKLIHSNVLSDALSTAEVCSGTMNPDKKSGLDYRYFDQNCL